MQMVFVIFYVMHITDMCNYAIHN